VWFAVVPEVAPPGAEESLDEPTRERARKIVVSERRARFVNRRRLLHQLIEKASPGSQLLQFHRDAKPRLVAADGSLQPMNASAAGRMMVVAFADAEVGIDIEPLNRGFDRGRHLAALGMRHPRCRDRSPCSVTDVVDTWAWCRFEAALKLHGGRLYDSLASRTQPAHAHQTDRIVAFEGHLCAIATYSRAPLVVRQFTSNEGEGFPCHRPVSSI
jgi:phosphopantetheinyl transferase